MKDIFEKAIHFVKKRPGLSFLTLILLIIEVVNIRPAKYIVGWDNYSSYFNLHANIFRSLFATWRDYRGLGVPSDSESLDIFRQLFFFIIHPFVDTPLLDQLYIISALVLGTISLYLFVFIFLKDIFKEKFTETNLDIAAAFAAFMYLFNLNTTSTFYFPMVMFINRYFSLPLLFLSFYVLLKKKKPSWALLGVIFFVFFATSGTYLVATIFITMIVSLTVFSYFTSGVKKGFILVATYIVLSAFWLLPFINYTIERSNLLPLAPTFIDANESQLNKPSDFFSLSRQSTLYPNFFDTEYTDQTTNSQKSLHPLGDTLQDKSWKSITFLFPILYLFGALLIVLKYKKRPLLWIPMMLGLFLFLSLKEFSPLGFLYEIASKKLPFFQVLFRFGDTKFHTFIAFSGSIAAGFVVLFLSEKFRKNILYLLILLIMLPNALLFKSYFTGNLIGPFMFNEIPSAYFEIAEYINKDKANFRVLHLPYDRNAYWKSYTWGAFGSSFLHYMIDKPFIDKTFEPASMENAYLHNHIRQLIDNAQALDGPGIQARAEQLSRFLGKSGVKYIILDETVSAEIESREMLLWGSFNGPDSVYILNALKEHGYARSILTKKVTNHDIELLQLNKSEEMVTFQTQARLLDPHFDSIFDSELIDSDELFIQSEKLSNQSLLYPLQRINGVLEQMADKIKLTFPETILNKGIHTIDIPPTKSIPVEAISSFVEVSARRIEEQIQLTFYIKTLPDMAGQSFREPIGQMNLDAESADQTKLSINDMLTTVPADIGDTEVFFGGNLIRGDKLNVTVLRQNKIQPVTLSDFTLTDKPNCFADGTAEYSYNFIANSSLELNTYNGSTCILKRLSELTTDTTSHISFVIDAEIEQNNDSEKKAIAQTLVRTSKPNLSALILAKKKPQYLQWCVKTGAIDHCYNSDQILALGERSNFTIDVDQSIQGVNDLLLLLVLRGLGEGNFQMRIHSMSLAEYNTIGEQDFIFDPNKPYQSSLNLAEEQALSVMLPIGKSPFAHYDLLSSGYFLSNTPCGQPNGYRTYRMSEELTGPLISYVQNCSNDLSIELPFSSRNFYLWTLQYNLLSGKYPKYVLDNGLTHYVDNYVGLSQGYPNVRGFKSFQEPEGKLKTLINPQGVKNQLDKLEYPSFYTFIPPSTELQDNKMKNFTLHQDSENEGIMMINKMNIIELPNRWRNMSLYQVAAVLPFTLPTNSSSERILPSLWKVTIGQVPMNNVMMFKFNQAYDRQWNIYSSLSDVITGQTYPGEHVKCDGYANCFILENPSQVFYIFYDPEKLNFLGWGITLTSILILFIVASRKR